MSSYDYLDLIDKNIIPDDCITLNYSYDNGYCYNKLYELPKLPDGLKILFCSCNKLVVLPELPSGLEALYCFDNEITKLPKLPVRLTLLSCWTNNITELPELHIGMEKLHCTNNNITELPELPSGLNYLHCNNNLIRLITTENYKIMKKIYQKCSIHINIYNTIFYDQSGCSSKAEFFGCQEE